MPATAAMKNFILIGTGGYIAPRHLKAIKDTGNRLLAALDKHDSVGVLDAYFPQADFFVEFERFDRHVEKLRRQGTKIDYVSVCSPNYLHDAHIRFGLRIGADVICEKPVVLNPWNVDALAEIEQEYGKKVFSILQLRLHPAIVQLRQRLQNTGARKHHVSLNYITTRGNWYHISWKGDVYKSGGIATNIGIHFFDVLIWLFGDVVNSRVQQFSRHTAAGELELANATVSWKLSIDEKELPAMALQEKRNSHRALIVDGEEIIFNDGFTELHHQSYAAILAGDGFTLTDARPAIALTAAIREEGLAGQSFNSF